MRYKLIKIFHKIWAILPVYGEILIAPECGTNRTFTTYAQISQNVLTKL